MKLPPSLKFPTLWSHPPSRPDTQRIGYAGLTILECGPPWSEFLGAEWTRSPIDRLTYSKQSGEWYYADRDGRFQRYWECDPSVHVADLQEEIDNDPTCIFWGRSGRRVQSM